MKKFFLLITLICFSQVSAFEITNKNINDLKFGKTNPAVKQLQIFLNENGFYESEEGPGSPDNETEYFGNATVASVKIFQEYSELPITGKVDFATGRAINDYIKEIEAEEEEYESADYFGDEEGTYLNDIEADLEKKYNLNKEIDTYKGDVTDTYLNTSEEGVKTEPKKRSLKDLLEGASNTPAPLPNNSPEKPKTIFQRLFSIFE